MRGSVSDGLNCAMCEMSGKGTSRDFALGLDPGCWPSDTTMTYGRRGAELLGRASPPATG